MKADRFQPFIHQVDDLQECSHMESRTVYMFELGCRCLCHPNRYVETFSIR